MKKLILILALWVGVHPLTKAQNAPQTVVEVITQWNEVLQRGNVDDLMHLYAQGALVLLPDGRAVQDPKEIRRFWRQLLAKRGGHYELDLEDVIYSKDDTVVSTLRWSELEGGLKYSYNGVIYNVFKRQPDGSWKAQVQRWN